MSSGSAKVLKPYVAQVRDSAIREFRDRQPDLRFAPVVVVIAAYDEEGGLGAVLEGIPREAAGMAVDTLVVDDGSRDGTSAVAAAHGVRVARLARNCGHGVALRLAYELAREHGARYIVTLDGDGQWDPADIPGMLEPLVDDEADLVLGSRVLGRSDDDHVLRRLGVRVFAALVRRLTGVPVTDTSTGLRAMRAEVTATVRQEQVQYQTAELLIGAIQQGYRVAEHPIVQHPRAAGESKKGSDLLYGFRYARVVLGTWWRGRRATGVGHPAARLVPAARVAGFVAAVAIVVVIGVRAAQDVRFDRLTWWPLPVALVAVTAWWLLLARGWAILVTGRSTAEDISTWCRTQPLRFLPGGVWAPASRVTVVRGGWLDRLSTVAAENVIALCAALAVGGVALAASGAVLWLPLVLALAAPALASRFVAERTRLAPDRTRAATVNYLVAFVAYALAAALVQGAVSGVHDPAAVAGAAAVAWAAGLVAVFAPGGVGIRELAYVGLAAHTLPAGELAAAAVTLRIVTIVAELGVLVVAGRPRLERAAIGEALAPALSFARRHALFLGLAAAGIAMRVVTMIAYRPALLSYDSQGFLLNAAHLRPDPIRPIGYPLFLRVLHTGQGLAIVPAVQHLMGLGMAVLIYALLLRLRVPRWAAALATVPILLDAYQLDIEHYVLAETLFEALLVGGCAALLWRRRPGLVAAAIAGLCFAGVALTRANGLVVIGPALVAVVALAYRGGPRSALRVSGVLLAAFAIPVVGYGLWFHRLHGVYGITDYGGRFLYARVTPFADCSKFKVPANERVLCPAAPVGHRPTMAGSTVEYYMWHYASPVWKVKVHDTEDFARRVIVHQPLDYLRTVGHDFLRGFAPIRTAEPGELPISRWQFPTTYPLYLENTTQFIRSHGGGGPGIDHSLASFLSGYRRFVFAPGPWLALGLVAGLLAALGLGRARRSGLRTASFLFAATGLVVFGSAVVSNQFSWRYALPLLVLLPPAASLGLTALLRRPEPHAAPEPHGAELRGEGPAVADPVSIS